MWLITIILFSLVLYGALADHHDLHDLHSDFNDGPIEGLGRMQDVEDYNSAHDANFTHHNFHKLRLDSTRRRLRRLDSADDHGVHLHGHRHDLNEYGECTYNHHSGHITHAEHLLRENYMNSEACGKRMPEMDERRLFYNALRTGEMDSNELKIQSAAKCQGEADILKLSPTKWEKRMPNQVRKPLSIVNL